MPSAARGKRRFSPNFLLLLAAFAGLGALLYTGAGRSSILVLLFVVTVQTWTLFDKVRGTYNDHVLTFDMHMPTWPFFAVAWVGDVSAVLLIAIRTYRLIFHPEEMHDPKVKGTE